MLDRNILKKFNLLFVEDDAVIRRELGELLLNFFSKVFIAKDGLEALNLYKKNRIDIILSDINMPNLNGIEMVKRIRENDKTIPIVFSTAHSDTQYLTQAIKLKIQDYLIKPIDIRELISTMSEIAKNLYNSLILEMHTQELERYKSITDLANIVIKTDAKMKITYVNELYCKISGFSKEELIGQDFKIIKYQDMSEDIFTKLYADVLNNRQWKGTLKNRKKDGSSFSTDCYMITTFNNSGDINGTISIQKDITEDLTKKREIQLALMKDKSDIFIRSKEGSVEQSMIINDLTVQLELSQENLDKALKTIDKYIFSNEKYRMENKNLKIEIGLYKKKEVSHASYKLSKENTDLKQDSKRLKERIDTLIEKHQKEISHLKFEHNFTIEELNEKINNLNEKLNSIQSDEVLQEKLEFWKEKSKKESEKLEELEKQILSHADEKLLSKIFQ